MRDGVPGCHYDYLGLSRFTVEAAETLAPGRATIRFVLAYDGGGMAKAAREAYS